MGEKEQGRKIPHSKKNPYIMTIGFDRTDPKHVEVADFLNSLPRKKAQYIVDAVICYKRLQENGVQNLSGTENYEYIRNIVMQVIRELNQNENERRNVEERNVLKKKQTENNIGNLILESDDMNEIISSIEAFRS